MGIFGNVGNKIRSLLRYDKDQIAVTLAKGATAATTQSGGFDLMDHYGYDGMSDHLRIEQDLISKFLDYESFDDYPETANSLDAFADDSTLIDPLKNTAIWLDSPDKTIKELGADLFQNRLRFDEELWPMARGLAKYGMDYSEALVTDDGLVGLLALPPPTMRRIEGRRGELYGFIQDFRGKFGHDVNQFRQLINQKTAGSGSDPQNNDTVAFEDWEVIHMRLRSKQRRSIYGSSVLDSSRWIMKRLMMLEDAAMVFRLERAPEKYAYYVDVGDMPPKEAHAYLEKVRQRNKKTKYYNAATGKMDMRYNPVSLQEDIYIPIRKGVQSSRVEVLSSPNYNCLSADTVVPLMDGTTPTIKELSSRSEPFWVYSIDQDGHVVPGRGHSARITQDAAKIFEVGLDNGEVVRCTGNHPFMTRDGKWTLAENLRPDDSLMPLYRQISDGTKRTRLVGYERLYDPADDKWKYTHHVSFGTRYGDTLENLWKSGGLIHHVNHNKLDNCPDNLNEMSRGDHQRHHIAMTSRLHSPESRAKVLETNKKPEVIARKSKAAKEVWSRPGRKDKHRKMMVALMSDKLIRADKGRILADWNRSQDHRDRVSGVNNARWRDLTVADLEYLVLATGARTIKELMSNGRIAQSVIKRVLDSAGVNWNAFAAANIPGWEAKGRARHVTNHKVTFVRETKDVEPVYCLTVDVHHNFAVGQGVFVSNSIEDLEYFRLKLFACLKVPKTYLGYADAVGKGTLSSEDVRFGRAVLRLQRELRNGASKMFRIHLAALNINPAAVEHEVYMTVPSSIFELAQLEVRNAKADFAGRMSQFVSMHWILSKVFGLSDEEVEYIIKERHSEQLEDAEVQAKAMGMQAQAAQPPQPGAPGPGQAPEALSGPARQSEDYGVASLSRTWAQKRQRYGYQPITEKDLFVGNRDHEKRVEDNLEKIMSNDAVFANRMHELKGLVNEIRLTKPRRQ